MDKRPWWQRVEWSTALVLPAISLLILFGPGGSQDGAHILASLFVAGVGARWLWQGVHRKKPGAQARLLDRGEGG